MSTKMCLELEESAVFGGKCSVESVMISLCLPFWGKTWLQLNFNQEIILHVKSSRIKVSTTLPHTPSIYGDWKRLLTLIVCLLWYNNVPQALFIYVSCYWSWKSEVRLPARPGSGRSTLRVADDRLLIVSSLGGEQRGEASSSGLL